MAEVEARGRGCVWAISNKGRCSSSRLSGSGEGMQQPQEHNAKDNRTRGGSMILKDKQDSMVKESITTYFRGLW